MANHRQGPGVPRMPHDFERKMAQSCYNLGVGYPPNPVEVWPRLMFHKENGQRYLNNNDLRQALNHYVMCLQASELFPGLEAYREERTKILCNMSLVLFKMRRFKDAEDNAIEAMSMNPAFIKSYWRAYQAVIGGHNGPFNALPYVMEGLRRSLQGDGTKQDVITFLTELCTFVPKLYNSAPTNERFDNMAIPDIMEKEIWTKTLQKLSGNGSWDSLRMLVLGNSGPMCLLQGFCRDFKMNCIDIGSLLEMPQNDLKVWRIDLAEKLLQQGAPVENIGSRFKKPTVHVCVQISINTGSTKLLEFVLRSYQHNMDAKNAQNAKGETALHLAVLSDKAYQAAVSKVTEVLLKHGCDPSIKDHQGRKAIDYAEMESTVYHQLKKADKTVDELRRDLEIIKLRGNEALKRGHYSEALKLYQQALDISNQSKKLYKEAAIVYSNTAKVYVDLNDFASALPNAIAAVSCDKAYHKGHWWKGKVLSSMGAFQEGFEAFMEGFKSVAISSDVNLNFLTEAISLLQQLNDIERKSSYTKLKTIDKGVLEQVLQKLSSTAEWKCVAYLILGPNLDPKLFRGAFTGDKIKKMRSGVAANCSMTHLDLRTVFFFIQRKEFSSDDTYWLDAVLVAICCHGNMINIDRLADDGGVDRPLHAVVRFGLLTGRTGLLEEVLKQTPKVLNQEFTNGRGDSVFHTITKMSPLPQEKALIKVTTAFLEKGFSPMVTDAVGYLPVDSLDKSYGGKVFDLFFKKVVSFSWDKVTQLKEEGNQKYNSGDVMDAISLYTDAINLVEGQPKNRLREVSGKDIAVLYGNRAEGFMKIGNFESALEDSKRSVSHSGNWYKGYLRVGRALKGLRKYNDALQELIKAYKRVDSTTEEKWRIDIMSEMTFVCSKMPRDTFDRKAKLPSFPEGQGNVWVKVAYELIRKDEWERAGIAYNQFKLSPRRVCQITFSLKPICNPKKLSGFSWAVDLILYFLECGADRKGLSLSEGDSSLHAAARICLFVDTSCALVEWLLKKYKDFDLLDKDGNTALHAAAKEKCNNTDKRNHIIRLLIKANVDPNIKNKRNEQAIDLLPSSEANNRELLRMAMHRVRGSDPKPVLNASNQYASKVESFENKQSSKPTSVFRKFCEECQELLICAESCFTEGSMSEGYGKLTQIFNKRHQPRKHQPLVDQAINCIITKLGEKSVPEIAPCLTSMPKECYQRVIDGLILRQKWRQLNAVVRKYRLEKGSDKFKGFASGLSVVPVIDGPVFKGLQDEQIQVIANMLNSGATMGSDNGQTALTHAMKIEHYKVVADLIKRGADLSHFTFTPGDTPIHAVVTLVIQKENALPVLEFVMDQYDTDPASFPHLNPCQQNKAGDCLFHLLTKVKCTPIVVKVTEFLCKRKLSAQYYNKDRKLPIHYITKKNDRRLQYIRLAAMNKPVGVQKFGPDVVSEDEEDKLSGDEMEECPRKDEVHSPGRILKEKVMHESERDQIKRRIEELIRLVPDGKSAKTSVNQDLSGPFDEECTNINEAHTEIKDHTKDNLTNITGTLEEADKQTENQDKEDDGITSSQKKTKDPSGSNDDDSEQLTDNHSVNDLQGPEETNGNINDQETLNDEVNSEMHHRLQNRMEPEDGQEKEVCESVIVAEIVEDIDDDKCVEEDIESESDEEDSGGEEFDAEVFDNLEWEVECTAEVWKTLRDKHVPPELKNRIMQKIRMLASGDWQPVLCKKLRNVPKTLDLFEAKFSKGSRILWEKAVAFSPRCSETAERRLQYDTEETTQPVRGGRIYSETIRVWEIVFDHDKIHRSVERIKQSHHRGEDCIIQKKLRGIKTDSSQLTLTFGSKIYPKVFAENNVPVEDIVEQREEMHQYFPPASSNDTEYHILKFYSFSSSLVNHVLQNTDTKVDFPFRVTDLEHAIINLPSKAPILLLGRSGTGKTTCCLYRLWSQFLRYWVKALEAEAPLIPRSLDFIHKEEDKGREQEDEDGMEDDHPDSEQGACGQSAMSSRDQPNQPMTDDCDHLHQLFITKNLVLCSEVQKNFHELSHAESRLTEHVLHEAEDLPNKLQGVRDFLFPLFLTSRQLLMMMDASIGPPYFFDRKEDGSLKADVAGWSDDGPLNILSLLEEDSDSEEEEEGACHEGNVEEPGVENQELPQTAGRKNKVDPRREITYPVFVEDVWPKIKKKMNYHPSLLWTEIMSFIKGSFEALSQPSGYLCLEDYLKLGRKRAPNFSADRQPIYQFFKAYEHFKKQNRLFDETDLVFNIYGRLKRMENRPWVVHQVYVDETQDFTQAELCLLIRMCQNPNDMFLTGDTAQSIMRGISFRFNDLRSLFFHAKKSMQAMGKTSAVEVPKKVYQLTHNYRSHAGILSLASSVLDLMVEFFPESFDRLHRDQGLFPGPKPILLESCSFGDLAVLLRGNKRKTSHIEFGAHQAILVVDEAAREAIPEELRLGLVLTIFEAKGLEFDDVLIYNFFKDSQAVKEWRVVTDFLERLLANQREISVTSGQQESLVEIDEDVLEQENRPRPLNFDPNQHKVLNSELKHLYTALTRARVNVWIFDEDQDKRAPMFEYFNARKLVKSITVSEINEKSLSETVFAEKSSKEDWIGRGEDFMRHSLYIVAAKCFGMAGDLEREKVALAHVQALKASRLKENPREMRREFLKAAEMYLECQKPGKAAICLQNAKELALASELFEKLGQYERAADIYKKLKLSIASSRCYEQLGNFDKAVEVLYDNENYDMAMDSLKRYQMRIKDYTQNNVAVPGQLVAYKPKHYYTAEKLSHKAAEKFHRLGNRERMLDAIDSIPELSDRVEFLKERNYIQLAAERLKDNGKLKEATHLLLIHGYLDDATAVARTMDDKTTLGRCILVSCRVLIAKSKEESDFPVEIPEFQQTELLKNMTECVGLFETCRQNDETSRQNDEIGEMHLLQADILKSNEMVKRAWNAFMRSKPVPNIAGCVECANWLIVHNELHQLEEFYLRHIFNGVGHMFTICCVLLKPTDPGNSDKVNKFLQFYGLSHFSKSELELYPKEKPLCLTILTSLIGNVDTDRDSHCRVDKEAALQAIVEFLLRRTLKWADTIWEALLSLGNRSRLCSFFEAGLECPDIGNVDNNCTRLHKQMLHKDVQSLIRVDMLLVEFEVELYDGVDRLKKICPTKLRNLVELFLAEGERDNSEKYKACRMLLDDLMPFSGHPTVINDERELIKYLQRYTKVLSHFRNFLKDEWKIKTMTAKRTSRCQATRETEVFILMEFGYHLFGLDFKCKLVPSPLESVQKLERAIDSEGGPRMEKLKYTTLVSFTDHGKTYMECIGKRFMESFSFISSQNSPNPFEAVFQFSKFVILQRLRPNSSQLPDLHHYSMWLEFYMTIGMILTAKLKTVHFPDFLFVLPSNYLGLLKFVEATFQNQKSSVILGIDRWQPKKHQDATTTMKLQDRLKYIGFGVCGFDYQIKILAEALQRSLGDPHFYAIAERIIVLHLVLVLNVGKAMPVECERSLMESLAHIKLPEESPDRLQRLAKYIKQKVQGIYDVGEVLESLLKTRQRGEELLICKWKPDMKQKLVTTKLEKMDLFSRTFFNSSTIEAMHGSLQIYTDEADIHEDTVEDQLTEEEIDKKIKERRDQEENEKLNQAATKITKFIRRVAGIYQARKDIARRKRELVHGEFKMFETVKVTDKHCGFCGCYFEEKLAESLKYEHSQLVGADSIMNPFIAENPTVTITNNPPTNITSAQMHDELQDGTWGYSGGFDGRPGNDGDTIQISNSMPTSTELGPDGALNSQTDFEGNIINGKLINLITVKQEHVQQQSHMTKQLEYGIFEEKRTTKILPKIHVIEEFFENPDYHLESKEISEKNYERVYIEIEKVQKLLPKMDTKIYEIYRTRQWSSTGEIDQLITELGTAFDIVRPYVEDIYKKQKENEEGASASNLKNQTVNIGDVDEYEVEDVVEEPAARRKKGKSYTNSKWRRGKRKQY